jgi:hypothetical protein
VHHILALLVAKDQFVDDALEGDTRPDVSTSPLVDEDRAAWEARVQAKQIADAKRDEDRRARELKKREQELAKLAAREVTPKLSEQRAKARAERLGADALVFDVDKHVVAEALDYMLSVCDGAATKDDQGFNKPDGCVARWLAPGVRKGSKYAVASAAAILRKYPRQLAEAFPSLFIEQGC